MKVPANTRCLKRVVGICPAGLYGAFSLLTLTSGFLYRLSNN